MNRARMNLPRCHGGRGRPRERCPFCSAPLRLIRTAGHATCSSCRQVVEPCCEGEPAPPVEIPLREVVIDCETTGLHPLAGDRIVEIAAVELIDREPTGREFHRWVFPDGALISADALEVHGLTGEFLADKPPFEEIAPELLAFLGDAPLVAHRASFDRSFVDSELARAGLTPVEPERWICSKLMAASARPTWANSLDALCRRFGIDLTSRGNGHGALVDARLVAQLYPLMLKAFAPKATVPISGVELQRGRVFVRVGTPGNWLEVLNEPGRADAAAIQRLAAEAGIET